MRRKKILLLTASVAVTAGVVWLYGTYESSEKTYSVEAIKQWPITIPDSIRRALRRHEVRQREEEVLAEYESAPRLGRTNCIYPVIRKWADFYGLDLSQARDMSGKSSFCFSCPDQQSGNPYYRPFTPQDDSADLIGMFYSPDRTRYIDVGIRYTTENGRRVRDLDAYDGTQQVYLVDRTLKQIKLLFDLGAVGMKEAAFWIDDETFVLAGYIFDQPYNYYSIRRFNIEYDHSWYYELRMDEIFKTSYHRTVVLKEMGIEP